MAPSIFCPSTHVVVPCKKRCIRFQLILTPELPLLLYSNHLYLMESLILKQQFLDKSTSCDAQGQSPALHEPRPKLGRSEDSDCLVTNDLWHHNLEQVAGGSTVWSS